MAFGQKGPGRPRGRPPKDPNARAYSADENVYSKRKLDSIGGSVLDPVLARQSVDDVEAALQQVRSQYEQNIDQRIVQANKEREAIQEQFNRLKELRVTHSEKTLMEWKRASEARQRHAIESLNAWKQRAEHAEHRLREIQQEDGSSAAPESGRRVQQLEEEVARLASKLDVARRERDAEMQRVAELEQKKQPTTHQSDDQQAVRRLYEDLTGFYVQDVALSNEVHNLHRFEMHFTSAGYHEESKLELPAHHSTNQAQLRDDLVYIPHLDEVRDASLLASPTMPSHFLEQIRFERSAANKFLGALQRALKR